MKARYFGGILLAVCCGGGVLAQNAKPIRVADGEGVAPRNIAPAPASEERATLANPLSPGRAEAFFKIDTGGDQMALKHRDARLVLILRYGNTQIRRTVAHCARPSLGTALAAGDDTDLELALCNGDYWITTGTGKVSVRRGDRGRGRIVLTYLRLGLQRAPDGAQS